MSTVRLPAPAPGLPRIAARPTPAAAPVEPSAASQVPAALDGSATGIARDAFVNAGDARTAPTGEDTTTPARGSGRHLESLLGRRAAPASSLETSEAMQRLSAGDQQRVRDLEGALEVGGRAQLGALLERTLADGTSALLSLDSAGRSLLDHLSELATMELAPELAREGIQRADLLESLLQECATPGAINQSNRATCTVTSMQYMLSLQEPSEYARLVRSLLTPEGTVSTRSGADLVRVADSIAPDSAVDRSATERLFQAAMMELANGDATYSNVTDENVTSFFGLKLGVLGLNGDQQERGLAALFGAEHPRIFASDAADALASGTTLPMFADLSFGGGAHAVVVEKIEDGRVFIRNPWGATTDPVGSTYGDPERVLEDADARVESMTLKAFLGTVRGLHPAAAA